ncbi:Protein disulfide isomerase-like [Castilleja foliolosa]|uniref:Protein disulfide isomerase-like n=1 Tax=Castilleja foliolosa TaxID=1961234 RepID=A0ABD3BGX9_9LAMI
MTERGRGYCGGRGGGRREDPLDDEGLHQRDLRDVKNDDLRREVRALRRRIARLEASRDGDFNFVVHYEDDDKNDNPFARAGGERRFQHRVADPGRDFGVQLEIPEFTGKVIPVVEIEGPPVYDEYPDEGVESDNEVVSDKENRDVGDDDVSVEQVQFVDIVENKNGSITKDVPKECFVPFSKEDAERILTSDYKVAFGVFDSLVDRDSEKLDDAPMLDNSVEKVTHFNASFKKSVSADFVSVHNSASLVLESLVQNQILLLASVNDVGIIPTLIKIEVEKLMADYFGVPKDGPKVYDYARNHNPKYYLIDGKITLEGFIVSGRHCSMLLLYRPTCRMKRRRQTRGRVFSNKRRMMQMRTNTNQNGCQNVSFCYFYFI